MLMIFIPVYDFGIVGISFFYILVGANVANAQVFPVILSAIFLLSGLFSYQSMRF